MSDNRLDPMDYAAVGINGATLAAERTSNLINCADCTHLVIDFDATRSAYTDLQFEVDWWGYPMTAPAGTPQVATASKMLGGSIAGDGTNTLETLLPYKAKITTSSSLKACFVVPVLQQACKIRVNASSGGASDTIKVGVVRMKRSA